jgi:hypothetical protein
VDVTGVVVLPRCATKVGHYLDTQYGLKSPVAYGGLQIVPRTASATLTGLRAGCTYHYRLVGFNEAGTSHGQDATFQTPLP